MRKTNHWKVYLFSILSALLIGALGSFITSGGMAVYDRAVKPPLTPPDWAFPVVWSLLYTFMGIGFGRILLKGAQKGVLALYIAQLLGNFLWTVLFFGFHLYGAAVFWLLVLWALIATMAVVFYKIDPLAGLLQLPYLLWVAFAGYLNVMIWLLN